MIIYERKDIPRPNLHRISVPPGQKIDIGVQKMFLVDETDQADCNKSEGGDFAFLPNVVYFRYACQENALYENIANKCTRGCVQHPYRLEIGPYANTPNCTLSNLCCLLHEYSNYDRNSTCTLCRYTAYEYENNYSSFPNGRALTEIANTINMSKEAVKDNFCLFESFYKVSKQRRRLRIILTKRFSSLVI